MQRILAAILLFLCLAPGTILAARSPLRTVFLRLSGPASVQVWRDVLARGRSATEATEAAVEQLQRNLAEQQDLREDLAKSGLDAGEAFALQRLANGLALVAAPDDLSSLERLPGVRSVRPVALLEKDNRFSAGYLGATGAWGGEIPYTGAGMRVGIIDTGIDYLHGDLGGPGADADYEADDPEILEEGSFPNAKVVGGWDFAGTNYGYSQEEGVPDSLVPVPDPDPMDLDGHGTHVSGSVAGYGLDSDGVPWPGPWDQSLDLETFRIGPGMAPEASLYALKVFGDTKYATASALTTAALEWAVDPDGDGDFSDHLDVVNISLGADYGLGGGYEVDIYENAVAAGLLIVAAAGNAWNIQFVTSDPCTAEGVVCVANCQHNGLPYEGLRVDGPEALAGIYLARRSNFGPELTDEDLTASLVMADPSLACGALVNPEAIAGKIALIDRGDCKYWEKVTAAQEAGAVAAVVVNNSGGLPPKMTWDGETVTIPSVILRQVDGDLLKAALAEGTEVTVTLRKGFTAYVEDKTGWIAGSSSRGPSRTDGRLRLKPDLTAPGSNITSAAAGTGDGASSKSGTSMASPTAAGIFTLLRQAQPDWTPAEIKAWAMSAAAPDIIRSPGQPALSPTRQGAGRIDAVRALETPIFAFDKAHPNRVGLCFEALDVVEATEEHRSLRIENRSDQARTFTVSWEPAVDLPGADVILPDGPELTIPAGEGVDLAVVLSVDPAALRHVRPPNLGTTSGGDKIHRAWFSEEAGHLVFRDGDEAVLRVPVLAGPRPASDLHAQTSTVVLRAGLGAGSIPVAGTQVLHEGTGPEAVRSLVTPFELKLQSPDENIGDATYVTEGFTAEEVQATINVADLRAIGLTSDYRAQVDAGGGISETTLYLALVTWGVWGSPVEPVFLVEYDLNGDGAHEGYFINRNDADAFFVEHIPKDGEGSRVSMTNSVDPHRGTIPIHMSDAMVMPLPAAAMGLTLQDASVALRVSAYHVHHHGSWGLVDATDWFLHDPTHQAFDFPTAAPGMPVSPDLDGGAVPFTWNVDGIHPQGLMLLHHHNPNGQRLDILDIRGPGCWRSEDCEAGTVCVPETGHCMDCTWSSDCGLGETCLDHVCVADCGHQYANPCPGGMTCDVLSGRCGACVYNEQCPEGTWCDPENLRCVVCVSSWECGPGEFCAPRDGTCAADCRPASANPCLAPSPWCNQATGDCAKCLFDAHCTGGTVCDLWATWTCVPGPVLPQPDVVAPEQDVDDDPSFIEQEPCPGGDASGCSAGPVATSLWPVLLLLFLLCLSHKKGQRVHV